MMFNGLLGIVILKISLMEKLNIISVIGFRPSKVLNKCKLLPLFMFETLSRTRRLDN